MDIINQTSLDAHVFASVEGRRRLTDSGGLEVEARFFMNTDPENVLQDCTRTTTSNSS